MRPDEKPASAHRSHHTCPALSWYGLDFQVDPDRALILANHRTVLITDPHFGKEASFQTAGLPVPGGGLGADLMRLTHILNRYDCGRLIILGDFYHNRDSKARDVIEQLRHWRGTFPDLDILLIRGNHDRQAGDPDPQLNIEVAEGPHAVDGMILRHEPPQAPVDSPAPPRPDCPTLAGHVHPAVLLKDRAGRSMRLSCFHFSATGLGLLPAFGSFTGQYVIRPSPGDRVIAVHQGSAAEIPVG